MKHAIPTLALSLFFCLTGGSCSAGGTQEGNEPAAATSGVVDSVFPMDVMLKRFRQGMREPSGLSGGAESRDALVEGVVRALEARDTVAFQKLALSVAEWGWLYYPTSAQGLPPYELPPGLAWLQFQENNRVGVLRALGRLGGKELDYRGYACDPEPIAEGRNRIWIGCLVKLGSDGAEPVPIRLFSAILERDGRFAVLSFANDF